MSRPGLAGLAGTPVVPGALTLVGFEPVAGGRYASVTTRDRLHLFARRVWLAPHATYAVELDVVRAPREGGSLHVDLFAPSFDPPESERQWRIDRPGTVRLTIPTYDLPPEVVLRAFYTGPAGLEFSEPRILRLPVWYSWAEGETGWAGWGLLAMGTFGVFAHGGSRVWRHLREITPSPAGVGTCLLLLYGLSVVLRFEVYEATPYWSGDEYVYKGIAASIWEFGDNRSLRGEQIGAPVDLPNPIYPFLIAPAFAWGEGFYPVIRLVNAAVMSAVVFPVYAIARGCFGPLWALAFALFSVCLPAMGLGAYVVTEAAFHPLVAVVAWLSVRRLRESGRVSRDAAVGIAIAIATGVRPTGLPLLPAYLGAVLICATVRGELRDLFARPTWLAAVFGFGGTSWLLQWMLRAPGEGGVGVYAVAVGSGGIDLWTEMLRSDPLAPVRLILGHVLTVAIPYAFFLGALVVAGGRLRSLFQARPNELAVVAVAATFFSAMFATAIAFTAYIAPSELGGVDRWHSRYYFITYPLLAIGGAVCGRRLASASRRLRRSAALVATSILAVGGAVLVATPIPDGAWFGSIVDNMDVQWMKYWPGLYAVLALGIVLATFLWVERRPGTLRVAGLTAMLWVGVATTGVAVEAQVGGPPPPFSCGRALASLVAESERTFAVFGRRREQMVGLGFWLPRTPALSAWAKSGAELERWLRGVGEPVDLILVNGDLPGPSGGRLVQSSGECRAYSMTR